METYNVKTKKIENKDMRKPENRKSQIINYMVLDKIMNETEKQYVKEHMMFDDFQKIPQDFEFHAFSGGMTKGIYKGKHVIIKECENHDNETVYAKIMEFNSDDECSKTFYFFTA